MKFHSVHWMEYDRGDSFPFDFEPNESPYDFESDDIYFYFESNGSPFDFEPNRIPFDFESNRIPFEIDTKWNSTCFKIEKKTVTTIIFHSIWKEMEIFILNTTFLQTEKMYKKLINQN